MTETWKLRHLTFEDFHFVDSQYTGYLCEIIKIYHVNDFHQSKFSIEFNSP